MELGTFFMSIEWIGAFLTLVAVFFIIRIGQITGWFKAWYIIATSFVLIVVRRVLSAYAQTSSYKEILTHVNSVLLLILGILYVIGFYMLYNIFKIHKKKIE